MRADELLNCGKFGGDLFSQIELVEEALNALNSCHLLVEGLEEGIAIFDDWYKIIFGQIFAHESGMVGVNALRNIAVWDALIPCRLDHVDQAQHKEEWSQATKDLCQVFRECKRGVR